MEDNEAHRRNISRVIGRIAGLRCPEAFAWCEHALEALKNGGRPDVMLLEVGVPGMSGIDGIRAIKAVSLSHT